MPKCALRGSETRLRGKCGPERSPLRACGGAEPPRVAEMVGQSATATAGSPLASPHAPDRAEERGGPGQQTGCGEQRCARPRAARVWGGRCGGDVWGRCGGGVGEVCGGGVWGRCTSRHIWRTSAQKPPSRSSLTGSQGGGCVIAVSLSLSRLFGTAAAALGTAAVARPATRRYRLLVERGAVSQHSARAVPSRKAAVPPHSSTSISAACKEGSEKVPTGLGASPPTRLSGRLPPRRLHRR